jgi:N-acetylglucosaminyl-diphospho-decaprenol L-rhamnosyltransferase
MVRTQHEAVLMTLGNREQRVVVIIVSWNSARQLPAALESLARGMEGVGQWGLVVVDNASVDESANVVRRFAPDVKIVQSGANVGYAAALNLGRRAAPGADSYLVMNPDVVLDPGCVGSLVTCLDGVSVGIAVPRQRDHTGRLLRTLRREPGVKRAFGEAILGGRIAGRAGMLGETMTSPRAYEHPADVDWASGSLMLVSDECWQAVGDWNESFFLYSEETDFCLRANDTGYRVRYCPEAGAVHGGGDSHVSAKLYSLLTLNRIRLYQLRHGRAMTWAFAVGVGLNELLRARGAIHRAALSTLVHASERRRAVGRAAGGRTG